MLVGLKSPGSLSPQSLLAALFKAEAGGRSCGRGSPHSVPFSSPGRQPPPLCLNVDLASPPCTVLGPIQEAAARMLQTSGSPLGPCLPIHSLIFRAALPPPYQPQSGCLQPTQPRPHPESAPLPKMGESRAWGSRPGSFEAFSALITRKLH